MNILNNKIDDLRKLKAQIKKLESMVKNLQAFVLENVMGSQGGSPNRGDHPAEEDAMFAKRPLLGWSCASCDKDINNLNGRPADF